MSILGSAFKKTCPILLWAPPGFTFVRYVLVKDASIKLLDWLDIAPRIRYRPPRFAATLSDAFGVLAAWFETRRTLSTH